MMESNRGKVRRVWKVLGMAKVLLFAFLTFAAVARGQSGVDGWGLLSQPGYVVLLRHASAPGVGDPEGFVLGDCATQRNLDERGRAQALALGARMREAGVENVRIYTSEWCRCRETAQLLGVGLVEDLAALNSFFEQPEEREKRVAALRAFLGGLRQDGDLVVMVTHQVTITALTGYYPASGEGVVIRLSDDGGYEWVATLRSGD